LPKIKDEQFDYTGMRINSHFLICGATGTGKSNALYSYLLETSRPKNGTFKHIFVVYKTEEPLYEDLKEQLGKGISFYKSIADLPSVDEFQDAIDNDFKHQYLIVFDDCVNDKDKASYVKVKNYFKNSHCFFLYNTVVQKNNIINAQYFKKIELKHYKLYNSLTKLIFSSSIYKKYISLIYQNIKENTYDEVLSLLKDVYVDIEEDILSFALQEMVDSKYKFKDKSGRIGYLIYRGNTYIFQDSKYTTKLSQEERSDIKSRSKLDMNALVANHSTNGTKEKMQTTNTATNTNANTTTNANTNTSKPTKTKKKKDNVAIEAISVYENLQKSLSYCVPSHSISEHVILESVLDRLSLDDIQKILTSKPTLELETKIYNALVASPLYLKVNNFEYVYIHVDDQFYVLKDGILKPVGPLDVSKSTLKDHKEQFKHKYPDSYKGFVEVKKDANFKIRDNPSMKGYVCHQTSSLTLDELKRRIDEIDGGILSQSIKKFPKRSLCDIYEFLLRKLGDKAFKKVYQKID
jgi:hypothetical protein